MGNPPFIDDFAIKPPFIGAFRPATFDYSEGTHFKTNRSAIDSSKIDVLASEHLTR